VRLALVAGALVLAAAAHADTGAGDLGPEARALVDGWLAAQNQGDFAAYDKLYAKKMTGVRRSGPRTVSLDRAGWMKDRQRMFQKPMKVTASDVRIAATPAAARVTFTQEWESGTYHDRGPKQLVVVREDGAVRIAREEMLASTRAPAAAQSAAVTPAAFIIGSYAIIADNIEEGYGTGAPRIDDDGDPVISSRRAVGLPPELAGFAGRTLVVYSPGSAPCNAKVKDVRMLSVVVPHFGTRQEWHDKSERERAAEAWSIGGIMVGARLEGCTIGDAAFARSAELPPLSLVAPATEAALRARAIAQLRALPSWRALQKEWVGEHHGKGRWDERAPDAEIEVQRWELPQPLVTVSAHAFDGCAGFGGEVFAVFEVHGDALKLIGEPGAMRPGAALMLDGTPTFFGGPGWSDYGTGAQLVPADPRRGGDARKLAFPYLDCPC
jgi:ketosteroid isomerase-like protein